MVVSFLSSCRPLDSVIYCLCNRNRVSYFTLAGNAFQQWEVHAPYPEGHLIGVKASRACTATPSASPSRPRVRLVAETVEVSPLPHNRTFGKIQPSHVLQALGDLKGRERVRALGVNFITVVRDKSVDSV